MTRSAAIAVATLLLFLFVLTAGAQESPRRTECRQWDDAFLALFLSFTIAGSIISTSTGLLSGLLGRRYWWATHPPKRILYMSSLTFAALSFMLQGWPRLFGLGSAWFSGISPDYVLCQDRAFSATGLFNGLIGANVPALAQWPAMTAILAASCAVGGVVAYAIGRTAVALRGLARVAKAGAL
jgi:hypothetical protein